MSKPQSRKSPAKKNTESKGRAGHARKQAAAAAEVGEVHPATAKAGKKTSAGRNGARASNGAGVAAAKSRRGGAGSMVEQLENQLISCMPYPVLVINSENQVQYVNPAAELFFHVSIAVMMRRKLDDLVGFGSPLLALVDQVRRRGFSVNEYAVELAMPRLDAPRQIDVHVCPLPECTDQHMIVLQERNIAHMIERQMTHRGAVKSVTALGAMLAHEIKNPLSGIKGAAQLLEPDLSDGDRELTQLICAETDRICKIVDRMDMFSEELRPDFQPQNIHSILNHVIQLASRGFASHIKFKTLYDPSLPPVPGNRDKLIQIYLNLVKNAAEALGGDRYDGEIVVHTAFKPGMRMSPPGAKSNVSLPIDVSIVDNGPGIPAELRPHIFEPFVTSKFSGSGLGLALTAKLINDHGGILDCDSYPGYTKFTTLLPKSDADLASVEVVN